MFCITKRLIRLNSNVKIAPIVRCYKKKKKTDTNEVIDLSVDNTCYHLPVMKTECCDFLNIKPCGVYVDCTLGAGGHSQEILARGGTVIGFDQDPDAIQKASELLHEYIVNGKLEIIQTNFRNIRSALKLSKLAAGRSVDGVLMDLGVSSHQINEPTRGFAFGHDGPLDMRMNKGQQSVTTSVGDDNDTTLQTNSQVTIPIQSSSSSSKTELSALRIVNEYDVTALADIFFRYGDEVRSRQIAREIVCSRPLHSTGELEKVISRLTSFKENAKTLARCFQALRIVVNDELGALEEALIDMHENLPVGGRLVVLSYHSLEDRRLKNLFRTGTVNESQGDSREELALAARNPWKVVTKRALCPSEEEVTLNRRARSAKLRVAEKR